MKRATLKSPHIRCLTIGKHTGLEPLTQTVPESNTTGANFTLSNNTQSLAGGNRDVMQTIDSSLTLWFGSEKVTCIVLCKNNCVQNIVNGGLSQTLARSLSYGIV